MAGGLGITDLLDVNRSLVLHSAWFIASQKNPLLSAILKSKYFPNTSFWRAPLYGTRSAFWASVMQVKHHLHEYAIYQINAGNSNIWTEPWCEDWENIHNYLNISQTCTNLTNHVSDLLNQQHAAWDTQKRTSIFNQRAADHILQIPKFLSSDPDKLCWMPSSSGDRTTKRCIQFPSFPHRPLSAS